MTAENVFARELKGGKVLSSGKQGWQLEIPETLEGLYALAQMDDYMHLPRRRFPHQPSITLELEARLSSEDMPGTWGFGFWNDPFSFGFSPGGVSRVLPVLPNASWFFYGSDQNTLSLVEDQPTNGFHVKVYRSPRVPSIFSIMALPALPFFFWPAASKVIRKTARNLVKEDGQSLQVKATAWHTYGLVWGSDRVRFEIDHQEVFSTSVSPNGKLGLVIWIDNQYMRFGPDGKFRFGYSAMDSTQWMQIRNMKLISQ